MKTNEPAKLGDAFLRLLAARGDEAGYYRARTKLVWEELFGVHVAQHTRDLRVRDGKLYIYLTNAPLRHQMLMVREGVRERLNEAFGGGYFTEVIVK